MRGPVIQAGVLDRQRGHDRYSKDPQIHCVFVNPEHAVCVTAPVNFHLY